MTPRITAPADMPNESLVELSDLHAQLIRMLFPFRRLLPHVLEIGISHSAVCHAIVISESPTVKALCEAISILRGREDGAGELADLLHQLVEMQTAVSRFMIALGEEKSS